MCGIVVTNDSKKLMTMYEANAERGKHSYSFCALNKHNKIICLERNLGILSAARLSDLIMQTELAAVWILHNQAPTTEARGIENVHPYYNADHNSFTWHNGILKPDFVAEHGEVWDTVVLSKYLNEERGSALSQVDGSFAFVHLIDGRELYIGRNEIAPMFVDYNGGRKFYFSSVALSESYHPLQSGLKNHLDTGSGLLLCYGDDEFTTHQMPYYLGDE